MLPAFAFEIGAALLVTAGLAVVAYGARVLDRGGSLLAFALALDLVLTAGYLWLLLLIAFVGFGFVVTKMFWSVKIARGVAEGKSGVRGWRNVVANGGVPAVLATLTLWVNPQDVALGFIAAIATAAADTFASELGVLSTRVYLITKPWERVPVGTNGGVSNWGHTVALGGSALASVTGVFLLDLPWRLAWIPIVAGWIGCQVDSVLGALFEEERGRAYGFMTKSDVNFLSIALSAFTVLLLLSV